MKKMVFVFALAVLFFPSMLHAATTFYYNDDGQSIRSTYDDGHYNEYSYDENGNVSHRNVYGSDGTLWSSLDTSLTFNDQGQMIESKYVGGDEWYTYTYNPDGTKASDKYYYAGEFSYQREYQYDAKGNESGYIRHNADGSVDTYTYERDKYGNIVNTYKGDTLAQTRQYTDTYLQKQAAAQKAARDARRKRIYTIEEAEKASKKTGNRVMIRYR